MKTKAFLIIAVGFLFATQPLHAQVWEPTQILSDTLGDSFMPAVCTDSSGNVYVAWTEGVSTSAEIYYKKSTDGGMTWKQKRLTWNSGESDSVSLALDTANNIYFVWIDNSPGNNELYFKKSTNGGTTWTQKRLTWNPGDSVRPAITVDSNMHIHVFWDNWKDFSGAVYYKKSTDGGTTWTQKRLTWGTGNSYIPSVAVDSSNNLHLVFINDSPGIQEVFYKKSTDGGTTWTTKRLTWNWEVSYSPTIATDGSDNLHVAWEDNSPGNWEIYYKTSTNGGSSWSGKRLTWSSETSMYSAIAADSNLHIHVFYSEDKNASFEIFHKKSTDGGTTWATKRLTWNTGESSCPAVAVDPSDNLHLVWEDPSPGNFEILYRKGEMK